ncbi:LemA family protein [Brevibacterium sp. SMBL_HHYL_HB1]|uniref:LemA family protein n=1 Tax=Brevibacterium sp. SMBL_HHYL_HB1 TaxID=2777556 RepID=UPI001BAE4E4F|nr:LemA family protein [Brevibacterium sp. SMBL_HHYL_HB1]QUL79751.1 LemA family protein [Brevibacterium sp. SMBL_HHYL_HB1]
MVWFIIGGGVAAALLVLLLVFTILRFNQLSMARSLCDEAKRQLIGEIRARHALVPAYIGTLQQMTGNELSTIALALASAERAPFGHRGAAAENALTEAVDEAALIPTANERSLTSGPAGAQQPAVNEEIDTTIQLLHGQLQVLTERILAAARFYNVNVERYHRQRMRPISRLFTSVFKPREPFTELAGDEGGPTSARGQE